MLDNNKIASDQPQATKSLPSSSTTSSSSSSPVDQETRQKQHDFISIFERVNSKIKPPIQLKSAQSAVLLRKQSKFKKCNTMAKLATTTTTTTTTTKSRLKQPISVSTITSKVPFSNKSEENHHYHQSSTVLSATENNQITSTKNNSSSHRARPTTLALRGNNSSSTIQTNNKTTKHVTSTTANPTLYANRQSIPPISQVTSTKSTSSSATSTKKFKPPSYQVDSRLATGCNSSHSTVSASTSHVRAPSYFNSLAKKISSTNGANIGNSNGLSLKHLNDRVNSSALVNNKLSPTGTTAATTTTMLTTTKLPTTLFNLKQNKPGNGKVSLNNGGGSNHKDGERPKKDEGSSKESKQDGNQIATHHNTKTTISAAPAPTCSSSNLSLSCSLSKFKTVVSSEQSYSTTISKRDKNNQFKLGNNLDSHLLSVASKTSSSTIIATTNATANVALNDKKQHGNNKLPDKRLLSHIRSSNNNQIKSMIEAPSLLQRTNVRDRKNENLPPNDNYQGHDEAESEFEILSNPTTPLATKLKADDANNRGTNNLGHALNDKLLSKPMGQQVLSLMMLDVGLLPANNLNHRLSVSPKSSHVSVQSPTVPAIDDVGHSNRICTKIPLGRDTLGRFNSPSIIDQSNSLRDHNDHNSLQSTTNVNGLLNIRVNNHPSEINGSISLPASPRFTRYRSTSNDRSRNDPQDQISSSNNSDVNYNLNRQSSARTLIDAFNRVDILRKQSNNFPGHPVDFTKLNQYLRSARDLQDNCSITSSSCSSLNHCPPLLTFSEHISRGKLDDLVKSKLDISEVLWSNSGENATNIESSIKFPGRQQNPTTDKNCFDTEDRNLDKIDCSASRQASVEKSGSSAKSSIECYENDRISPWLKMTDNPNPGDDTQQDPQLSTPMESPQKRQTQLRSHSISGQEFNASGGYQRLKNFMYNNQNGIDIGFDFHTQPNHTGIFNNRGINFNPVTSYQQQQQQQIPSHHVIGRSPSPSLSSRNQPSNPMTSNIPYRFTNSENVHRNPLHSSLECLNSTYTDYQQQLQNLGSIQHQQQQQQLQQQQQQFPNFHMHRLPTSPHNQHYAATYVMNPTPTNTIVIQNGKDLSASVMSGTPSTTPTPGLQQYQSAQPGTSISNYAMSGPQQPQQHHQQSGQQNMINRAMAHVSQSPLRRIGLNHSMLNTSSNISSTALLNHLSNSLHHPIRAGHSSLSLASSSYAFEDKLQNEIRKLQSDLKTEKEKNDALNNQLEINSGVMAAFEQSIITLNDRLRQLTSLNEKKDDEIKELKEQLSPISKQPDIGKDFLLSPNDTSNSINSDLKSPTSNTNSENNDNDSEKIRLMKEIEDLKRQLTVKDRLLTDTRLEAISVAHQLEQLESRLNGEQSSLLNNDDDLDEGVMVVNHSPSDSDAVTDSAHFSEINNHHLNKSSTHQQQSITQDNLSITSNNTTKSHQNNNNNHYQNNRTSSSSSSKSNNNDNDNLCMTIRCDNDTNSHGECSPENLLHMDEHSDHSSEFQIEKERNSIMKSMNLSTQYNEDADSTIGKLMDNLLVSN